MSEPDEKERAELWEERKRCSDCNGFSRWNKSLGAWEPCECRLDDEEEGEDDDD